MGMRRVWMGVVAGVVVWGGVMLMTVARGANGEPVQRGTGWQQFMGKTMVVTFDPSHLVTGKLVRVQRMGSDEYLLIEQSGTSTAQRGEVAVNTRMIRTVAGM